MVVYPTIKKTRYCLRAVTGFLKIIHQKFRQPNTPWEIHMEKNTAGNSFIVPPHLRRQRIEGVFRCVRVSVLFGIGVGETPWDRGG
jgi:hypothetical protein